MPITLSNIANKSKHIVLWFGDDSLNIEYYPNLVTEETFLRLQEFSRMSNDTIKESFDSYNETLAGLIKSWDLLEDDGQSTVPITPERLVDLGVTVRGMILSAIMDDIQPKNADAPKTRNS